MGKRQLTPVDMGGLEVLGLRFQNLASAPATNLAPGLVYFDSTTGKLMWRNAAGWIDPLARANHSGTQPSSSIANFTADVVTAAQTLRLDQLAAPTAAINFGSQRGTNVAAPVNPTDAARLVDLQNVQQAMVVKTAVRVMPTVNVTVAAPGATHDGITLAVNDRLLLGQAQTAGAERGLWVYNGAAVPLTRAADGATGTLLSGSIVPILEGTANADTAQQLITDGAITVGTTSQTWQQFAKPFVPVAGSGISVVGSTISAALTSVFGRVGAVVAAAADYAAHYVPLARTITAGAGLTGGGDLTANRTLALDPAAVVAPTRTVTAGAGLTGGGALSTNITLALDTAVVVAPTRAVTAGAGLTGGGPLSDDVTLALDFAAVGAAGFTRKFAATLSTSATSYAVTHNLGTTDVTVGVFAVATGEEVIADVFRTSGNVVTIGFAVAPTAGAYRVVVVG